MEAIVSVLVYFPQADAISILFLLSPLLGGLVVYVFLALLEMALPRVNRAIDDKPDESFVAEPHYLARLDHPDRTGSAAPNTLPKSSLNR